MTRPDEGIVVWFTGLPASGKSTLARAVRARLLPDIQAVVLESDDLREVLRANGYGDGEREQFYRILGQLAVMLAKQGYVVLVAATAPLRSYRDRVRTDAPSFVEVHVATPLENCEARDPKDLYNRARNGNAPTLPGIGAVYEAPLAPEVTATGGWDAEAVERAALIVLSRRAIAA
jgi:adenylylsulfate kinase